MRIPASGSSPRSVNSDSAPSRASSTPSASASVSTSTNSPAPSTRSRVTVYSPTANRSRSLWTVAAGWKSTPSSTVAAASPSATTVSTSRRVFERSSTSGPL